ncbi:Diphthamide biosynthesis protein 3 [Eutypa lata]|uniref:Diphthamide biosynthesis protein 3 n=1 Tax=Eutypa lata (strain UCR-EL1) TaxID=1287681 RepID=M7T1L9_EUTLA|nr:putative diphthamide biosynthesis protein 3 protein [Eutypa lata UCREL1]KAI1257476.1 Diphthamide biosynthesis protein 3 [Eutypa lata]
MAEEEIAVYDEVEIEDMEFDESLKVYHYPCPCGDKFEIALADLQDDFNDIAVCPSCSLMIRVIYDQENLWKPPPKPDDTTSIPKPTEQPLPIAA